MEGETSIRVSRREPTATRWAGAALLAAAVVLTGVAGCAPAKSPPPQHVVLVTIDTLRADHLGMYGYPRDVSPFLDELAQRSALFTNAYASSSHTMPSHASLFTSLFPAQHGTTKNGQPLHERVLTMAETFRELGYATAGFTTVNFLTPLAQGFDTFESKKSFHPADRLVEDAIAWLDGLSPQQPSFLWLHLFDVHQWWRPEHLDPQMAQRAAASATLTRDELVAHWRDQQGMEVESWDDEETMLLHMNRYDGEILHVDRELRRFYEYARAHGLLEDGLWIVTADHGEGLGTHGFRGHGAKIYGEQIRIPLLLHFADGRHAGAVVDSLVRHVDLFPTLAELLDVDLSGQVFPIIGRSLLPLLHGREPEEENRYAYAQRRDADERRIAGGWEEGEVVSLQTLEHKYILHSEGGDEFYDLRDDPGELRNLVDADSPDKERLRRTLERMLAAMKEQGKSLGGQEIEPAFIEELRALGYL
jgi:arylsulfatase A-like enzyme